MTRLKYEKDDTEVMREVLRTQLSAYYQNLAVSVFEWTGLPEQTMRIPRRQIPRGNGADRAGRL